MAALSVVGAATPVDGGGATVVDVVAAIVDVDAGEVSPDNDVVELLVSSRAPTAALTASTSTVTAMAPRRSTR